MAAPPYSTSFDISTKVLPSAVVTSATPPQRRRNHKGTPSPDAEVISLSPETLMAKYRFVCEVCNKGFLREVNLQLHRRSHDLSWKLKQMSKEDVKKKVYVCPVPDCVHHDPLRALGDLSGIKRHFSRKHGEKIFMCEKCNKMYAVLTDCRAHTKICGTRRKKRSLATAFSRFVTNQDLNSSSASTGNTGSASATGLASAYEQAFPIFGSFTSFLNDTLVGSGFGQQQLTVPEPIQLKLGSQFGRCGSLDSYYSGMIDHRAHVNTLPADVPTQKLSATSLLQRASLMGSSDYNCMALTTLSLGSSSSGEMKMSNYGGGGEFGDGIMSSGGRSRVISVVTNGPSIIYGAFGGGMESENNYGMYKNVKRNTDHDENKVEGQESVQSGNCGKCLITRDFLGLENRKRSSGENDQEVEIMNLDSEAVASASETRPFFFGSRIV